MDDNCRPAEGRSPSQPTQQKKAENSTRITHAKRSERAQRAAGPARGTRIIQPGESLVSNQPTLTIQPITYDALIFFHIERIKVDDEGNQRSRAVLRNHKSVAKSWITYVSKGTEPVTSTEGEAEPLLLGNEIISGFIPRLTSYLEYQEEQGKSKSTLADRKCILWSFHESALELVKINGLPKDFSECLTYLVEKSGKSVREITRLAKVAHNAIFHWMRNVRVPSFSSRPTIQLLEKILKVQEGTLTGRLPTFEATYYSGRFPTGATPWREHQKKMIRLKYILKDKDVSTSAKSEFNDLTLFYTDDEWAAAKGFERNSVWHIRPNRGTCPTAEKVWLEVRTFYGFLSLPTDSEEPLLRGRGLAVESFSLALLSDPELVIAFLGFLRSRNYLKIYNSRVHQFLTLCITLLKEETGFLRQQPEYGSKLSNPVQPEKWDEWCETSRARLMKFRRNIKKFLKDKNVVPTRDPFAGVRKIIEERDHPLDALFEMTSNMRRLIPLKAKGSPKRYAVFMRDLTLGEFIASYPLRVENLTMLTWVPKDPTTALKDLADILNNRKVYIETEDNSHLYQKPDGSWWVRFWTDDVKNGKPIDVPVAKSIIGTLVNYLLEHRPVLNEMLKQTINKRREAENLSQLSPEEESEIDLCPFIFRPHFTQIAKLSLDVFATYRGTEQMSNNALSVALYRMSQRYIPNCIGFHAHAVRHLVASEYIKNYPNGFEEAAAALNITAGIVEKHYAWVPPCTKIKPWQDHFEHMRERFESSLAHA